MVALLLALPVPSAAAVSVRSGFEVRNLETGIQQATTVSWDPAGRMFVGTKLGRVYVVDTNGTRRKVLDISSHVNSYSDRGLEGIAVDSDFDSNHYLWILYVYEPNSKHLEDPGPKKSRLVRVTVHPDDTVSHQTIVLGKSKNKHCPKPSNTSDCIPADGPSHMVGTVRSAPDGTLWVGSGDGSNFEKLDPVSIRAQNVKTYAGKILHIDRSGRGLPGHPFCRPRHGAKDDLKRICAKVYAKGLRNPYRFDFRPGGGLIAGDVGWATREELDYVFAGRNYGWPCYEGGAGTKYGAKEPTWRHRSACKGKHGMYSLEGTSRAARPPVYDYPHGTTAAIIGGPSFPGGGGYPGSYTGKIFFGDFPSAKISTFDPSTHEVRRFASDVNVADLELAPDGRLVAVDIGAEEIREFVPTGATAARQRASRRSPGARRAAR
jgi:glucose/arabinose dehydrogenase